MIAVLDAWFDRVAGAVHAFGDTVYAHAFGGRRTVPLIGSEESASYNGPHPNRLPCAVVGHETPLVEIDRAGCSTMGGASSSVRLDVLLTFRAHDQRWAWHIPR
jgi:hypothetical protein